MKTTITLEFDALEMACAALNRLSGTAVITDTRLSTQVTPAAAAAGRSESVSTKTPKPAAAPSAPETKAAPPASSPAAAPPTTEKVEYSTLQKAVLLLAGKDRPAAEAIIAGYGFSKFTELAPGQWAEVLAKVTEALGAGK